MSKKEREAFIDKVLKMQPQLTRAKIGRVYDESFKKLEKELDRQITFLRAEIANMKKTPALWKERIRDFEKTLFRLELRKKMKGR